MPSQDKIKGRTISPGRAEGRVLRSEEPIGFYGNVDLETGEFIEKGHELEGKNVAGKVLVFPEGKGSTVGSYVIYGLKKNGKAPAAIINKETETIVATGAILADIPCMDHLKINLSELKQGQKVVVDAKQGFIQLTEAD